jgi:hypothetical protein
MAGRYHTARAPAVLCRATTGACMTLPVYFAAVLPASFFGSAGSAKSGDTSGSNGNGGAGGRSGNANNYNSNFNKVFSVAGRKLLTTNWGGQSNNNQQVPCPLAQHR